MIYGFKKIVSVSLALVTFVSVLSAREKELRFDSNGQFKIAQFTDMHLYLGHSEYRDAQAEKTFARLSRVVSNEKPDLLVFTGDIVTGGDGLRAWNRLIDSLNIYKLPFCVMFGNHDPEVVSRTDMSKVIVSSQYSFNELNDAKELADMELEVMSSKGDKVSCVLYCMDSHDYPKDRSLGKYAWFETSQIEWLRNCCMARREANGGEPVNSLAFFHICLQEYGPAFDNPKNYKKGRRAENECPGALNSGMFAAMVETGNIMGVFVGHDHDNDYVVLEKGIALGYGRFSGDYTTYTTFRSGVRIIVLDEGKRGFETWILEDEGRKAVKFKMEDNKFL
jgi:predicted phosphodiesterase